MNNVVILIVQIAVILIAARLFGFLFKWIWQPQVIGEMVAGILLGPSLLGWAAPGISAALFPPASLSYLNTLSQIGIVIYIFLVGLALNPRELKRFGRAALVTSNVSIIVPFTLGAMLALYLYPRLSNDTVSFTSFALFMGAAMSITAFPVLARILKDRNMLDTKLGMLAIACAAVDDVTGWCILAYIVVIARAHPGTQHLWLNIVGLTLFTVLMFYGVRPLLRRFYAAYRKRGSLSENALALLLLVVLVSALATELLGVHLLFGAFLAGVVMPKEPDFVRHILDKFESLTVVLLVPLFFAFTGLRTTIGMIHGGSMWLYCGAIILVAITGKLGCSMLAARASGVSWNEAAGLGILLNTRGLMELLILNIGLDIGVISPALFAMMVLMALITTFMTTPMLEWICPQHRLRSENI